MAAIVHLYGEPDALITERDLKESIRFAAWATGGYLFGLAARRAYDRRTVDGREGDAKPAVAGETVGNLR